MTSSSIGAGEPCAPWPRATILALSVGNALELYDFTIYSFFALTIGKLFFPVQSAFGPLRSSSSSDESCRAFRLVARSAWR
ncbi:hypothetical protein VY88_29340 [Azospirillum thiophilum]|uniref:Major facilitator superfamily (MFS) profile domain-containing protein n=1 Tax=Azospirillum thiophilum TaxID=528244 RepID=A0AAC8ZWA5_9PROT|nr:hypothetical protein [Azospirillum thiophilum]ALG74722.1 hypothetical protein AL072_27595 [Azospirillum thiophilum]KJR61549.1 hypothetical protein VY88_29340 [Azospirillum thiophilum]